MPEKTVEYFGFATVGEKMPLLVGAPEDRREMLKDRHGRDGVIFTEAEDMPSLEALLEAHQVSFAVLQLPPPLADQEVVAAPYYPAWRSDASARLAAAIEETTKGDALFHEDYAFIPALDQQELDAFLARAYEVLHDQSASADDWQELLLEAEQLVAAQDRPALAFEEEQAPEEEIREPLFTVDDLSLTLERGAIGGPMPLVHSE